MSAFGFRFDWTTDNCALWMLCWVCIQHRVREYHTHHRFLDQILPICKTSPACVWHYGKPPVRSPEMACYTRTSRRAHHTLESACEGRKKEWRTCLLQSFDVLACFLTHNLFPLPLLAAIASTTAAAAAECSLLQLCSKMVLVY